MQKMNGLPKFPNQAGSLSPSNTSLPISSLFQNEVRKGILLSVLGMESLRLLRHGLDK